jgi:hypothetical protein
MQSYRFSAFLSATALALLVFAVSPARRVAAQTPTPGFPSICFASFFAVQAPPGGAAERPETSPALPVGLSSLDEAQAAYDFPLLLPSAIPSDYRLSRILYFHSGMLIDTLHLCDASADGHYIQIREGYPIDAGHSRFTMTPEDERGTVTILGHKAFWTLGNLVASGQEVRQGLFSLVWQPGALRLGWETDILVPRPPGAFIIYPGTTDPVALPPLYVTYEIESDVLDLGELVSLANSVRPTGQAPEGP